MRACGSRAERLRCLSCSTFVRIEESVIRSAMSSPCWSPPHLLSSNLPQHEAPPGQHHLLQEDTVHPEPLSQEPLPKTTWSESNVKEPLSHINYECGGNLRPNTPTEAVDRSTEEGWDASAVKDGDDDDRTRCRSKRSSARCCAATTAPLLTSRM